jgi:methionyl-tRNA synthetase
MTETFYLTTPIYYVNDVPHIGHAYTTIATDVLARYHRLLGQEVFFLTGTDEHGQKIQLAAQENNETPQQLADRVVLRFQEAWQHLNISHNEFIRTTQKRHIKVVQSFFKRVQDNGDIYLGEYEDWYCTNCESFITENQLQNEKCPDCNREVKKLKEESYFFRLSQYTERLLNFYKENPDFIQPDSRRNEIVNFVKQGLRDLSLSRTTFQWGIPVPDNERHVVYVWFDALLNYISALGFGEKEPEGQDLFDKFWPANIHLVGKDIIRFHTVYWPAFLMAGNLALPKRVFAHGWWTIEGQKMSKSLGNAIDPNQMVSQYGADAFRYFLLREVPFGQDGNFSVQAMENRMDSDLANDLGNLLSRSLSMLNKFFGNQNLDDLLPQLEYKGKHEQPLQTIAKEVYGNPETLKQLYDQLKFQEILVKIWQVIRAANKYIDSSKPWELAKDPKNSDSLAAVMCHLLEVLRLTTLAIDPFMPTKAQEMWQALGIPFALDHHPLENTLVWGKFPKGARPLPKPPHLFPRLQKK